MNRNYLELCCVILISAVIGACIAGSVTLILPIASYNSIGGSESPLADLEESPVQESTQQSTQQSTVGNLPPGYYISLGSDGKYYYCWEPDGCNLFGDSSVEEAEQDARGFYRFLQEERSRTYTRIQ